MDEARVALQRASVLDPNSTGAMASLALLEMNTGRLDQGLYWAQRGFVHAPTVAQSFYSVSNPLLSLDNDVGERFLRAATQRFRPTAPGGLRLQLQLAVTEWRKGDTRMRSIGSAGWWPTFRRTARRTGRSPTWRSFSMHRRRRTAWTARSRTDVAAGTPCTRRTRRAWRAFLFLRAGDRTRAQPLIDAALAATREATAAGDVSYNPPMENAVLFLMQGKHTEALDALKATPSPPPLAVAHLDLLGQLVPVDDAALHHELDAAQRRMSFDGSASVMMRSASLPGSTLPARSWMPSMVAASMVAGASACSGVMPAST